MTSAAVAMVTRTTAEVTACSAIEPAARAPSSTSPAGSAANRRSRRSSASTLTAPAATTNGATSAASGDSAIGSNPGRTSCCHGGRLASTTPNQGADCDDAGGNRGSDRHRAGAGEDSEPVGIEWPGSAGPDRGGARDNPRGQRRKPERRTGFEFDEHGDRRGQACTHAEKPVRRRLPNRSPPTPSAGGRRRGPRPIRP